MLSIKSFIHLFPEMSDAIIHTGQNIRLCLGELVLCGDSDFDTYNLQELDKIIKHFMKILFLCPRYTVYIPHIPPLSPLFLLQFVMILQCFWCNSNWDTDDFSLLKTL